VKLFKGKRSDKSKFAKELLDVIMTNIESPFYIDLLRQALVSAAGENLVESEANRSGETKTSE